MILTFYLSLFLILILSFIFTTKSLNKKELSLFLIIGIFLNSHAFTILMEIKWFFPSYNPYHYVIFLFYRTCFIPFVLLYLLNLTVLTKSLIAKGTIIIGATIALLIFERLNVINHLYTYKTWSVVTSIGFYGCIFLFISLIRRFIMNRDGFNHDTNSPG